MTVYISPNPGKISASEVALRPALYICRWNSVWNVRT